MYPKVIDVELSPGGAERHGKQPGGPLRAGVTFLISAYEADLENGAVVRFTPEPVPTSLGSILRGVLSVITSLAKLRPVSELEQTKRMCHDQGYELSFDGRVATLQKLA